MIKAIEAIVLGKKVPTTSYNKIVKLHQRALDGKQMHKKDLLLTRQALKVVKTGLSILTKQEDIDLKVIKQLADINMLLYQSWFNRNGIKIINIVNTGGVEGAKSEKVELLRPLKNMYTETESKIKEYNG